MTQTRAATAVMNLRSKQELVRLLFEQGRRKGPTNHRILVDHSSYSYNDLKKAYLERIQVLHPDKRRKNDNMLFPTNDNNTLVEPVHTLLVNDTLNVDTVDNSSEAFVQLQSAWENYDNAYKYIRQTNGTDISFESNFTLFGVGCSFSDTDRERDLRNEIMDQASKGWFAAGVVTSGEVVNNSDTNENDKSVPSSRFQQIRSSLPIIDQNDFIAINDNYPLNTDHTNTIKSNTIRRKFLVEDRKGSKT